MGCSHEELSAAHENLALDHALLTNELSSKEIKTSESSSYESRSITLQFDSFVSPCDMKQWGDGDELVVAMSSMHEPT